jgi:F0F1-type ATP synthase membrane subunit b/b'
MADLFREILQQITADPVRFSAEVVQSLMLLGILGWAGGRFARTRLSARRSRVAAELAGAEEAERESSRIQAEARALAADAERQSPELVRAAEVAAGTEREKAIAAIAAEAEELIAQARQTVERERSRVVREASGRLVRLTAEAARRYLDEMLTESERRALTQKAILASLEQLERGGPTGDAGAS